MSGFDKGEHCRNWFEFSKSGSNRVLDGKKLTNFTLLYKKDADLQLGIPLYWEIVK
jgi:hypothetical protein